MNEYPDRYVITALIAEDSRDGVWKKKKGDRVWLYWSPEGGGWWQWGPEGWARRFESKSGREYEAAMFSASNAGPWFNKPDPATIEAVSVPAILTVS